MQYKLVFIKTAPDHTVAGIGVGGDVMMTLSMLSNMTDDDCLYVDMETNGCIWAEDRMIWGTNNPWEYFFFQRNLSSKQPIKELTVQETGEINFRYEDGELGLDLAQYAPIKNRFYKNFKLKSALEYPIRNFYNEFLKGKITLGVQIRLTDMQYHHRTKGWADSVVKINEILKERPEIEQIFLATDDETVIPFIEQSLPRPVLYYKDIYRATESHRDHNPDDRLKYVRNLHRYLLGKECLQDIFTLTKCDYFLKADKSAISIVTCILAENIKQVYKL